MFVKRGILLIGFAVLTIHISTGFADDCAKVVACQSSGTKVDGFNLYEGSPMCSKLLEAIPYEKISECEYFEDWRKKALVACGIVLKSKAHRARHLFERYFEARTRIEDPYVQVFLLKEINKKIKNANHASIAV